MIRQRPDRILLCGVPIDPATPQSLADALVDWSASPVTVDSPPRYISYVNAHVHNLARREPLLRQALIETSLCYADGASIVWACRWHGERLPPRLTAADFLPDALDRLAANSRRMFLLGGAPDVADAAVARLQIDVPSFVPVGSHHGYFDVRESDAIIQQINDAQADVLIVGMGSPRQEQWVHEHRDQLRVPVIWSVGALFDYFAGIENRCPAWMGDHGFEWLYRLLMQPRRMAGRYLLGNPQFVLATLLGKLERTESA